MNRNSRFNELASFPQNRRKKRSILDSKSNARIESMIDYYRDTLEKLPRQSQRIVRQQINKLQHVLDARKQIK